MFSLYCNSVATFSITSYFLGNIFSACFYGALTVQLYRYYMSFPKDRKPFKAAIYIVYVTETVFTVLLIYDLGASVYDSGILNLDLDSRTGVRVFCAPHSLVSLILAVCGGTVELLTQSMYAYRIRIITKLRYISWAIILVMVSKLFALITISLLPGPTLINVVMTVWASISLIVDVTITGIMIWSLKKDAIYCKQLKRQIARLTYVIIGTGFLTTATSLCLLVFIFVSFKYTIGLIIVLSKLYANSMMVLVNSRIPYARSEIDNCATLDMITIQLGSCHVTSQEATADAEHGQREALGVDPDARSVGLSAHVAEDTANNYD